ncbi:MAG: AAA family ATPase [Nitrososphaeria archaeon]
MVETLKENVGYGVLLQARERILKTERRPPTFIREIIVENFMSYEYARIPLTKGLNIICGPNGSGKSSILLGISVALGQIYTERSRKLSDLIRRGKDLGRVTVVFDNRPVDGRRPISFSRSDSFMLSRYLRKDGSYWFETDYKEVSSSEVREVLSSLNINPDNMLLIMHQGMVEEFALVNAEDKLKMVEDVVGLSGYREKVLDSQRRLQTLISEETSVKQLMGMAEETLTHWKDIYDRFLKKQELISRRNYLLKEKFWVHISKLEKNIEVTSNKLELKRKEVNDLSEKVKRSEEKSKSIEVELHASYNKLKRAFTSLSFLLSDKNSSEARKKVLELAIHSLENMSATIGKHLAECKSETKDLKTLQRDIDILVNSWSKEAEIDSRKSIEASGEAEVIEKALAQNEEGILSLTKEYAEERANVALLAYQRRQSEKEAAELERNLRELKAELANLELQKPSMGPRAPVTRQLYDIDAELSSVTAQIEAYADVPNEAKDIFESYSTKYKELKERLELVLENKKAVLSELEERKKVWRKGIHSVLESVNPVYQEILRGLNAYGYIRLTGEEEFEKTGLELLIGFRGATPAVLDAYTLSGGERSTATISFLLALQRLSPSPIVAVDEFDVHMDPVNRERIFRSIFQRAQDDEKQYIVITPSQVKIMGGDINYVVTQMIEGRTEVGTIAGR